MDTFGLRNLSVTNSHFILHAMCFCVRKKNLNFFLKEFAQLSYNLLILSQKYKLQSGSCFTDIW